MRLLNAKLDIGPGILWREIIGNGFGLASALLGMRRRVAAWPVGIVGNILLFTVFLGGVFNTPQDLDLWGQAGRQIFFFAVSLYGWYRWSSSASPASRRASASRPGWAGKRGLLQLVVWRGGAVDRVLLHPEGACTPGVRPPTPGSSPARSWPPTAWLAAGSSSG